MIQVCSFSSDSFNLAELNQMSEKEKFEYCKQATAWGDSDAQAVSLSEFQYLFNNGRIDSDDVFIFFIDNEKF